MGELYGRSVKKELAVYDQRLLGTPFYRSGSILFINGPNSTATFAVLLQFFCGRPDCKHGSTGRLCV